MNYSLIFQREKIRDYIEDYMKEDDPNIILQLGMLPGVGKTFTTLKYFLNSNYHFIYLSSMHKIIEDNLKKIMGEGYDDIIHLRGRGKLCINKDYRKLEKYGVNISPLCKDCPYKNSCEYYRILFDLEEELQSWVGVYEHLITQVPRYKYLNNVDTLVVDECPINRLRQTKVIKEGTLDYTERVMEKVNRRDKTKTKLEIWIKELSRALRSDDLKVDFELLKENRLKDKKFEKLYNRAMIEHWKETREIKYNIIPDIFFLSQNLRDDRYNNSAIAPVKTRNSNRILFLNIFRKDVFDIPLKMIILDATTPPEIYDKLTDKAVDYVGSDIYPDVNVYQLTSAKYCMSTIDRRDKKGNYPVQEKLFHYVEGICRKHAGEKVLVVCRKKYEKVLQEYLKAMDVDNFTTNHYGGLRGSNEYMDYDVCVLMGGAYLSKNDLERDSILMGLPKDKLYEQVTKNEMIQCLHRIRPILGKGKVWYILSNEELNIKLSGDKKIKKLNKRSFEKMLFGDARNKRIRNEILELLKNGALTRNEILEKVKADRNIVNKVLTNLVQELQVKKVEEKRKRVRPVVRYIRNF